MGSSAAVQGSSSRCRIGAVRFGEWADPITDSEEGKAIAAAVERQERDTAATGAAGFRSPRTPVAVAQAPIDVLGAIVAGLMAMSTSQ